MAASLTVIFLVQLIFMDQFMPEKSLGTDIVRRLRKRGIESTICGLSANGMEESFLNAGADAFLLKPFPCDTEAMKVELLRICNSRSSSTERD